MPRRLALLLCACSASILAAPASAELPDSAAFREKQMTWSGKLPGPSARPEAVRRRYKRAVLVMPRLSSRFGYRYHPIRHTMALHAGIDIPGPMGTPIQASAAGTVRFAGSAGGYGNMIEIDHGGRLATRYAHLSRVLVRRGMTVGQGETIALMGSTGLSTGSHLHFEVRAAGRAADPLAYLTGGSIVAVAASPAIDYSPAQPHLSQFARARNAASSPPGDGPRVEVASLP